MRLFLSCCVLLALNLPSFAADTTWVNVSGTVTSASGAPIQLIEILENGTYVKLEGGSFSVKRALPRIQLTFTASDHETRTVNIYMREPRDVSVNVTLTPNLSTAEVTNVRIIGDYNAWSFDNAKPMTRVTPTTFSHTLLSSDGAVRYQVLVDQEGKEAVHSINGTQHDEVVNDGGGDYRSVIRTSNAINLITYDLSKVTRSDAQGAATFVDPDLIAIHEEMQLNESLGNDFYMKARATAAYPEASQELWSTTINMGRDAYLRARDMKDSELRDVLVARCFRCATLASQWSPEVEHPWIDEMLRELPTFFPVNSVGWALCWPDAGFLGQHWEDPAIHEYLDAVFRSPSDFPGRSSFMYMTMRYIAGKAQDSPEFKDYMKILNERYPDSRATRTANNEWGESRAIQADRPLPTFDLAGLHESDARVTTASLKGKYTLIDLWATWCGPCIGEMPNLQKAYAEFKKDGFEVVSISIDPDPTKVDAFRENRFPMPWTHASSPGNFQSEAAQIFEVNGIPKVILVDPDGKILKVNEGLRGEALFATLESILRHN